MTRHAYQFYHTVVLKHATDECLLWPYGHTARGYAVMHVSGKHRLVHRVACEAIHGAPPSPAHQAAHKCGNGHLSCVNPRHVRWATRSENQMDRVAHGTDNRGNRHGMSKLTGDQVKEIRALKGLHPQREIGEMYGVSQTLIGQIHRGVIWGHAT